MVQTLEDRIQNQKPSIWDSLVSAYSSSKAVKIGLAAAGSGYSYFLSAVFSGTFYLASKTAGVVVKNLINLVKHPITYVKNIKKTFYDTVEFYKPFGRFKNPTIIGGTLSAATHYTGF